MTVSRNGEGRGLLLATWALLAGVAAAEGAVAVYAAENPNGIQFEPWPPFAELVGIAVILLLVAGIFRQARQPSRALLAVDVLATAMALTLLALVAFVLSFNQL
jgi:hypothetical protein